MFNNFKDYHTWAGIAASIIGIIMFIGFNLLYSTFTWLLWNKLMTAIFNLPSMTWLQMLGFYIMIRLFFGIKINFNNNN